MHTKTKSPQPGNIICHDGRYSDLVSSSKTPSQAFYSLNGNRFVVNITAEVTVSDFHRFPF